jgi:hypothetical protein
MYVGCVGISKVWVLRSDPVNTGVPSELNDASAAVTPATAAGLEDWLNPFSRPSTP